MVDHILSSVISSFIGLLLNRSISLVHYAGPKKVMPPVIANKRTGLSYTELTAQQTSLHTAHMKDAEWLNSLSKGEDSMEWNGFNNQLARSQGIVKPATQYLIGPLLDAPPHHPDTILTTLQYMQGALVDMGVTYIHLSMDMQLFEVTKQVCWHDPVQFHNVITHPGGMHIIQSFLGCIAKLMRGSGLKEYISAAYGGLTGQFQRLTLLYTCQVDNFFAGILNGKSSVKAMRSFRGVAAEIFIGWVEDI